MQYFLRNKHVLWWNKIQKWGTVFSFFYLKKCNYYFSLIVNAKNDGLNFKLINYANFLNFFRSLFSINKGINWLLVPIYNFHLCEPRAVHIFQTMNYLDQIRKVWRIKDVNIKVAPLKITVKREQSALFLNDW